MAGEARAVRLIVNPTSGGGRTLRLLPRVGERLTRLGVAHRAEMTRDLEHAGELARSALDAGEIPVALSGDGVAAAVAAAGALRGPQSVIGVLPGGSGNDFCRHAGIPADAVDACAVIAAGEPRGVDLGAVGDHRFLGIATVGFDSEANAIANRAPRVLGGGIYVYGALAALARWRPARFTVELDGDSETFSGWSVVMANTSVYGGGMYIAPDARVDDGLLDVVLIAETGRMRFLRGLTQVFRGTHVRERHVRVVRARAVQVSASRPFTVFADGDPIADLPVSVRALPAAVRVLLPA